MCFLFGTYFIILLQEDFIYCLYNNIIVLFLTVKFISNCGIVPAVLSMPNLRILRTKISQDLAFIWWLPGAMYDTCGFGYIIQTIYTSFTTLASTLTNIGVSIWWFGFSSHFPAVTSTVGIFPSRFFYKKVLQHIHK